MLLSSTLSAAKKVGTTVRIKGFNLADVIRVHEHMNRGVYGKLRWAFDPRSNHPQGKSVGPEGTDRVLRQIEKYDLIWFSKIRSASMLAQWSWPRSVLDLDDVPSVFETSVLQNGGSIPQKFMTGMRRLELATERKIAGRALHYAGGVQRER